MRKTGILMPISSLPSPYGIGTLGKAAYDFVDFLAAAGQSLWQILPLGPTGYGASPYQCFSAFAGNPYFVDLDLLASQGLLTAEEIGEGWGDNPACVDYGLLFEKRPCVLAKAVARQDKQAETYQSFCTQNAFWLEDYATFMALKEAYNHVSFQQWPEPLRIRQASALQAAQEKYAPRIEYWRCVQYFFFCQWLALRQYANACGIEIVGDIPIYVSPDSSDLWASPQLFQTTSDGRLAMQAGVPPDSFSASGQLWGNPLYDWPYHKRTKYAWWLERMRFSAQLYDVLRIDHFRGFASYYAVPADATDATMGEWRPGPGKSLMKAFHRELPDMAIMAEDLGFLTEEVFELLVYSGYAGMKILQFAFDSRDESDYLPHNYPRHTWVYTGTHDNTTLGDWQYSALPDDVAFARRYLGLTAQQSLPDGMIRAALSSVADTAVIPLPDWLHLGIEGRINTPSTLGGQNWQWRAVYGQITPELCAHIGEWTKMYGRLSVQARAQEGFASDMQPAETLYERTLQTYVERAVEKAVVLPPQTELTAQEQKAALEAGLPSTAERLDAQESGIIPEITPIGPEQEPEGD